MCVCTLKAASHTRLGALHWKLAERHIQGIWYCCMNWLFLAEFMSNIFHSEMRTAAMTTNLGVCVGCDYAKPHYADLKRNMFVLPAATAVTLVFPSSNLNTIVRCLLTAHTLFTFSHFPTYMRHKEKLQPCNQHAHKKPDQLYIVHLFDVGLRTVSIHSQNSKFYANPLIHSRRCRLVS